MAGKDREQRKRAILQAARLVFARKGFDPATLEAVAREAGLAKGTLYLYFRDKEDLFFHTVQDMMESLEASIREQMERPEGALQKLRAVAAGQFAFFAQRRDTLHLFAPFSNPSLARLHKRLIGSMMERWAAHVQRITALVEEGQRAGALRPDLEAWHIALAFLGMVHQASQSLIRQGPKSGPPQPEEPKQAAERMADTIMRILLEGVMQR